MQASILDIRFSAGVVSICRRLTFRPDVASHRLRMRVTDGRSFFKAMDKDGSGTLDLAEVARGLKRLGLDVSASWTWEKVVCSKVGVKKAQC